MPLNYGCCLGHTSGDVKVFKVMVTNERIKLQAEGRSYVFVSTPERAKLVESGLPSEELIERFSREGVGGFCTDGFNTINSVTYAVPGTMESYKHIALQIAEYLNSLIAGLIHELGNTRDVVRVKEIASGTSLRWQQLKSRIKTPTVVELSDYIKREIDVLPTKTVEFQAGEDNLLDIQQVDVLFDLFVGTYATDTVWHKDDLCLRRNAATAPWELLTVQPLPLSGKVRRALEERDGSTLTEDDLEDLALDVCWVTTELPVELPSSWDTLTGQVFYPGGVVRIVEDLIEKQGNSESLVVLGEVAYTDPTIAPDRYKVMTIPKKRYYHVDSLDAAKAILEKAGYKATLLSYGEMVKRYFGELNLIDYAMMSDSERELLEKDHHSILVVRKVKR